MAESNSSCLQSPGAKNISDRGMSTIFMMVSVSTRIRQIYDGAVPKA